MVVRKLKQYFTKIYSTQLKIVDSIADITNIVSAANIASIAIIIINNAW